MEVIIWILVIAFILWLAKNINKSKWIIWTLLYNEDFLLKPYSKSDLWLIKLLKEANAYEVWITKEEILIFKWYLWSVVFSKLKNDWINYDESSKILKELNRRFPIDFPEIKVKLNENDFKERFELYNEILDYWFNENDILDISNLFQTWELWNSSYNIVANLLISSYLKWEFEKLDFAYNHLLNDLTVEKLNELHEEITYVHCHLEDLGL